MARRIALLLALCLLAGVGTAATSTKSKADWWFCVAVTDHNVFVSNSFETTRGGQVLESEFASVLAESGRHFDAPLCTRGDSRAAVDQMIADAEHFNQRRGLSAVPVEWAAAP